MLFFLSFYLLVDLMPSPLQLLSTYKFAGCRIKMFRFYSIGLRRMCPRPRKAEESSLFLIFSKILQGRGASFIMSKIGYNSGHFFVILCKDHNP